MLVLWTSYWTILAFFYYFWILYILSILLLHFPVYNYPILNPVFACYCCYANAPQDEIMVSVHWLWTLSRASVWCVCDCVFFVSANALWPFSIKWIWKIALHVDYYGSNYVVFVKNKNTNCFLWSLLILTFSDKVECFYTMPLPWRGGCETK